MLLHPCLAFKFIRDDYIFFHVHMMSLQTQQAWPISKLIKLILSRKALVVLPTFIMQTGGCTEPKETLC